MKILIKQFEHAKGLELPHYATDLAAGMDLRAAVDVTVILKIGERKSIPTGIAIALPKGYEAQIRPRSGLALKKGITMLNSPGTIDADYRGEIHLIVINHGHDSVEINRGERIAQMVISEVVRATLQITEELDETARGESGFGSTGIG